MIDDDGERRYTTSSLSLYTHYTRSSSTIEIYSSVVVSVYSDDDGCAGGARTHANPKLPSMCTDGKRERRKEEEEEEDRSCPNIFPGSPLAPAYITSTSQVSLFGWCGAHQGTSFGHHQLGEKPKSVWTCIHTSLITHIHHE